VVLVVVVVVHSLARSLCRGRRPEAECAEGERERRIGERRGQE